MDYEALLAHVLALLQREQRLSYRVLKLRLQLDDDTLEALKACAEDKNVELVELLSTWIEERLATERKSA